MSARACATVRLGVASVAGSVSAHAIERLGGRATFILAACGEAAALKQ